ncbi:caspase domain-containing protein [Coprinopsis sp. MPI-PUGE-AT-0042]|nr:caspase domain-containing protein [Coprinopsis sp. MPI-PUGE-AT-0042]
MIAYDAIASEKRTPLFAIIIGINNYEDASLSKLSRSVPDAEAINEYLQTDLKVPSNQIIVLCNKEASRANILDAFEKMKRDTRIQKDDPILIYYAGHASELTRETGDPIQVIFPQDYNQESEVKAIPDCKIVALLDDLAETHGNNITVILDCCHSGTLNRGEDNEEDPRADTRANGFARRGVRSHVLLAAFSANEQAREGADACKGRFTVALLELLRATGAERLVYADVLRYINPISGQKPRCEGYYRNRAFFDAKVVSPSRTYYYDVKVENGKYILLAGSAHGIAEGDEFTIYKDQDAIMAEHSLAVMRVSENGIGGIQAFTTTLSPPPDLPGLTFGPNGLAIAVQTKIGMAETFLLHVPLKENCVPIFSAIADELGGIGRNACRVMLVDRERAEMEMLVDRKGFTLATLDPRLVASGIYRLPHTLEPNVDATKLRRVLRAAAHYTFNLNHTHANNLIEKKIEIQFKQLFGKTNEWDEDSLPVVTPGSANLVRGDKIDFIPEVDGIYGFEIKNDTPWNLYVCCFYFDSMDLSIVALTPVANRGRSTQDFMLPGKGGTATIGYGPSAIAPVVFDPLPQGIAVAGGYFKFYFTTVSLNLSPTAEALNHSHVPKTARADDSRPGGMRKIRPRVPPPTWGTITLPVIRRRAQ